MFVSARQASRMLELGRETTNRVLASGLAGPPVVTGAAHLYNGRRVQELAERPVVDETTELPPMCAEGVLVARVDPRSGATDGAGPWRIAAGRLAVIACLLQLQGSLPLVVTVGGFVLCGSDVTGYEGVRSNPRLTRLRMSERGEWYDAFDLRAVRTEPGNPLLLWRCRLAPPIPRREPLWQTTLSHQRP